MKTLLVVPLFVGLLLGGAQAVSEFRLAWRAAALLDEGKGADSLALYHRLVSSEPRFVDRHRLAVSREWAALAAAREQVMSTRFLEAAAAIILIREGPLSGAEGSANELSGRLPELHLAAIEALLGQKEFYAALQLIHQARATYPALEAGERLERLQWRTRLEQARLAAGRLDLAVVLRTCAEAGEAPLPVRHEFDDLIRGVVGAAIVRLEAARDYARLHKFLGQVMTLVERDAAHVLPEVHTLIDQANIRLWGAPVRNAREIALPTAVRELPDSQVSILEIRNHAAAPLRIRLVGPEQSELVVAPRGVKTATLKRGEYLQFVQSGTKSARLGVVGLKGGSFLQVFDS